MGWKCGRWLDGLSTVMAIIAEIFLLANFEQEMIG